MLRYSALLLTVAGLVAGLWIIGQAGWHDVLGAVARVGPRGFAVLMGWTGINLILLGAGWLAVAPGVAARQLGTFAWARLAREAATDVLPFSQFGGLVVGARTAIAGGIRAPLVYASLIADQTTELAAQLVFTLFGAGALMLVLWGGGQAGGVLPLVLAGTAGMAGIMIAFAFGQRPVLRMAQGLAARLLPGSVATMAAMTGELEAIYRRRVRVLLSFLCHLAAWVFSACGAWVAVAIMGQSVSLANIVTIEALIFALRTIAFAIPGGVGVQEAGYLLLGPLFGLSPGAALGLSLVKRARDLGVGIPGIVVWQILEARALGRK